MKADTLWVSSLNSARHARGFLRKAKMGGALTGRRGELRPQGPHCGLGEYQRFDSTQGHFAIYYATSDIMAGTRWPCSPGTWRMPITSSKLK